MIADAAEREAFEKWAYDQWQNSRPPDNAWLGWQARAALPARAPDGSGIQAECQAWIDAADTLIESLQEGIMTDAGIKQGDREKMRAQIDALDALKQERAAMLSASPPPPEQKEEKPAPFKIEEGKFYRTRGGYKAGPMRRTDGIAHPWGWGDYTFTDDGFFWSALDHSANDLVAEWTTEPPASPAPGPAEPVVRALEDGEGPPTSLVVKRALEMADGIDKYGKCGELTAPYAAILLREMARRLEALTQPAPASSSVVYVPPKTREEAIQYMRDDGDAAPESTAEMNYPHLFEQPAPAQVDKPKYVGWYCPHCQRGVDPREVTFSECHEVCGTYIADAEPPAPVAAQPQPSTEPVPIAWMWDVFEGGVWEPCHARVATAPDLSSWRAPTRNLAPLYPAPPPASDERVAAKDWRENDLDIVILSERRNAAAAMRERCARAIQALAPATCGPDYGMASEAERAAARREKERYYRLAEMICALPLDGEG